MHKEFFIIYRRGFIKYIMITGGYCVSIISKVSFQAFEISRVVKVEQRKYLCSDARQTKIIEIRRGALKVKADPVIRLDLHRIIWWL